MGALGSARAIDALPLLNAIVLETFRLYPAIAGAQARRTPLLKNTKLGVHDKIPSGIRVAARASSLHMNPAVYPQPDTWQPERWLNATSPQLAEMNRWLWVFGSGGRMCIGSHFATHGKRTDHTVFLPHSLALFFSRAISQFPSSPFFFFGVAFETG